MDNSSQDHIKRLQFGDRTCLNELFYLYYRPLCYRASLLVNSDQEAEDIVQSVFIDLWERRSTLFIDKTLQGYLIGAVNNRCKDFIKREMVKRRWTDTVKPSIEIEQLVFRGDELLLEHELRSSYNSALEQLSPRCREVFNLSREKGLKYREIAELLGISVKTVENQMNRALSSLRKELKEYFPLVFILLYN